jgi:putative selenium metabolism protein SsnA
MAGICFKDVTLACFDPARVERGSLRVEDGLIAEAGKDVEAKDGDEIITLDGGVLTPGLVVGHHHLYSALARGMPAPPRPPARFTEILDRVWWVLDRVLDDELIELCSLAGLLAAVRCGATGVIDHHASPSSTPGSLDRLGSGFEEIGVRGMLCYETSDRAGSEEASRGVEENRRFLRESRRSRLLRGAIGAHASFTLSDESLEKLGALVDESGAGIHIHVLEGAADRKLSEERWGGDPISRLERFGLLNERALLAHCVHLTEEETERVARSGAWVLHNSRSNMNNVVGRAPLGRMEKHGVKLALGTDGIDGDVLTEARAAFYRGREEEVQPAFDLPVRMLGNAQRALGESFGRDLATLDEGTPADLTLFDYGHATPLTAANLAGHLFFGGMGPERVHSVMVDGELVLRDRRFERIDERAILARARKGAVRLWDGMERLWKAEL